MCSLLTHCTWAVKQVDAELKAGTLDLFAAEEGSEDAGGGGNMLPPGWASAVDPSTGNTYYYNDQGVTQWEPPV